MALEREYDKRLTGFVEKNIDIIKQFVPEMAELLVLYAVHVDADGTGAMTRLDMLKEKILGNVNRRELVKDLTEEIQRIAGLEKNRAALIARDQVGKLNGQLTRFRQENAGIGEYEWSSSHDSRVRPTHRQFDGKIYSWQGSPQAPEGPPGWPIRCRCVALPVIDLDKIVTKPVPGSYRMVQHENAVVPNNGLKNDYTVNFSLVNSKAYRDKFTNLATNKFEECRL